MNFLCSGVFWGSFVVLLGLSIILKELFHWDIPVFRLFFGVVLVGFGVRMILGTSCRPQRCEGGSHPSVLFNNASFSPGPEGGKYDVVFGQGQVDVTGLGRPEKDVAVRLDVVFGEGRVVLKAGQPVEVRGSAAFGGIQTPSGNLPGFGDHLYRSAACQDGKPRVIVEAHAVFGGLVVEELP